MAELSRFSFSTGRAPTFDTEGNLTGTRTMRFIDHQAMLARLAQGDDDDIELAIYYHAGPFEDPRDFYFLALNKTKKSSKNEVGIGMQKLLRHITMSACTAQDPKLMLAHPNLNVQNILVAEDGSMRDLIDWGDVAAVPRLVANESYPGSLGSPETGIRRWNSAPSHVALAAHGLSATQKSLHVENLLIATMRPIRTFKILDKFVQKIVELARMMSSYHINEKYRDLGLFDITDDLVEGKVERELLDFLRSGFETLVNQSMM